MNNILVLIPTYNEVNNISSLYSKIKKNIHNSDILFIDDNSPDGTAKEIKKIVEYDPSVKIIIRKEKLGIGSAHAEGIKYAYKKNYETLITMDADFTHNPETIKKLINKRKGGDIVIASRYIRNDGISDWNLFRKTLAITGHILTKKVLGISYDATSAFRLYNLKKIDRKVFDLVESTGYSFFFESLYILVLNNYTVNEIPVRLSSRTYGSSKMKLSDALHSLKFIFQTAYLSRIYRDSYISYPSKIKPNGSKDSVEKEWDDYWKVNRNKRKIFYDSLAVFYRKFIIKPTLNYHIKLNFNNKSKILHAGCGGGQVDSDIVSTFNITALDISSEALNRYKHLYKHCRVLHGSIMSIPAKDKTFDGVYNLGVMEHLSKKDIKKTLDEFNRILKTKGKIVLFWPPFFGLSVIFLNSTHFFLNKVLGGNIQFHPHEISKIKSKKQIEKILKNSNFRLAGFHFGIRDLFTYVVVVGEKIN